MKARLFSKRSFLAGLILSLLVSTIALSNWLAAPAKSRCALLRPAPWEHSQTLVLTDDEVERRARVVDGLVTKNLAELGLEPAPIACDEVFVRRVYLDIVGRIPLYDETTSFLQSVDPDKRSKLIERLLASDGYACHFFNYWADLLRLKSQTAHWWAGSEYAEWLKQSLRDNKPYDQFVYELLTAAGYPYENGAVGYRLRDKGMLADNVSNTMQLFLGTRVACAECHDDPEGTTSRREFIQLSALFSQSFVSRGRRATSRAWMVADRLEKMFHDPPTSYEIDRRQAVANILQAVRDRAEPFRVPDDYQYADASRGATVAPAVFFGPPISVDEGDCHREVFARWVVSRENPRFASIIANRLWKKTMGAGLIEPVDDWDQGQRSHAELLQVLAQTMVDCGYDLKQFLRILFNTDTYQRESLSVENGEEGIYRFHAHQIKRMSAEQLWDSLISLTVPEVDQRRGFGSAIVNSRDKIARVRSMWPFEFAKWSSQPLFLSELQRRTNPAHAAPFVVPKDVADDKQQWWTWDMTGAVDPRWAGIPRDLVRACELQSPAPADHFLRVMGQSDRDTIEGATDEATVSQALALLNSRIYQHMWERNAVLAGTVPLADTTEERIHILYSTLVSRAPQHDELHLAKSVIEKYGDEGSKMVAWALINSAEFLFIQ